MRSVSFVQSGNSVSPVTFGASLLTASVFKRLSARIYTIVVEISSWPRKSPDINDVNPSLQHVHCFAVPEAMCMDFRKRLILTLDFMYILTDDIVDSITAQLRLSLVDNQRLISRNSPPLPFDIFRNQFCCITGNRLRYDIYSLCHGDALWDCPRSGYPVSPYHRVPAHGTRCHKEVSGSPGGAVPFPY